MRGGSMRPCKVCEGNIQERLHNATKYCSETCKKEAEKRRKKRVQEERNAMRKELYEKNPKKCECCQEKILYQKRVHLRKYCPSCSIIKSEEKQRSYARKRYRYLPRPQKNVFCKFCNKKFLGHKSRKYCSRECSVKALHKKLDEKDEVYERRKKEWEKQSPEQQMNSILVAAKNIWEEIKTKGEKE